MQSCRLAHRLYSKRPIVSAISLSRIVNPSATSGVTIGCRGGEGGMPLSKLTDFWMLYPSVIIPFRRRLSIFQSNYWHGGWPWGGCMTLAHPAFRLSVFLPSFLPACLSSLSVCSANATIPLQCLGLIIPIEDKRA